MIGRGTIRRLRDRVVEERVAAAEAAAERNERALEQAKKRHVRARELGTWAQWARDENHLSQLFREGRAGGAHS